MKIVLEFNMPEDTREHSDAVNGWRYRAVLTNLDEWLRSQIKYHDKADLQPVRDNLWEELKNNGVEHALEFD